MSISLPLPVSSSYLLHSAALAESEVEVVAADKMETAVVASASAEDTAGIVAVAASVEDTLTEEAFAEALAVPVAQSKAAFVADILVVAALEAQNRAVAVAAASSTAAVEDKVVEDNSAELAASLAMPVADAMAEDTALAEAFAVAVAVPAVEDNPVAAVLALETFLALSDLTHHHTYCCPL